MPRTVSNTKQNISRRTFLKRSWWTALSFIGLCSIPFYGYFRERNWLETVRLELPLPSLPQAFDGVKIVHFSDIHYGFYYGLEQLSPLIDKIIAEQPDLILYTGDLFDGEVLPYREECAKELQRLSAPLGKFAVPGNHDYYTGRKLAIEAYENSGFQLLINKSAKVTRNKQTIQLAGLDDMFLGRANVDAAFSELRSSLFTILLAHEPEFADRTSAYRVDLQLSGHSHGGQVRLPLIGEVMTPPGGKKYVQGLHPLENQDGESYVYTTRGIGTTHIPIRFLCRPELTVLTLKRKP